MIRSRYALRKSLGPGRILTGDIALNDYSAPGAIRTLLEQEAMCADIDPMREHLARDPKWCGVASVDALATVIRSGDRAATARVQSAAQQASDLNLPKARTIAPAFQINRLTGQRYDLGRVLQGAPGQWGRYERSTKREGARTIALYLPLGGNVGLTAEQISWGPVAAVVIADLLEQAGYRAELWAFGSSRQDNDVAVMRCALKDADQPLDLNAIARLASPAITRIIMFANYTLLYKRSGKTLRSGHGDCRTQVDDARHFDADAIAVRLCNDEAACAAEIKRVIADFQ